MSVVLLSGGLDSMIMLAEIVQGGDRPLCMTFDYGQRHSREISHAKMVSDYYGCRHATIDIRGVLPGCPLTGEGSVPLDQHYESAEQAQTVVPNRNAVFISIAAAEAASHERPTVFIGCHASDEAVYRDCRPSFVSSMDSALFFACGVRLQAPFLHSSRTLVVQRGRKLGVPFEMAWSCYLGGDRPCGRCGACVERAEAGA